MKTKVDKGGKRKKIWRVVLIVALSVAVIVGVLYGLLGVRIVSTCAEYETVPLGVQPSESSACVRYERVIVFAYVGSRSCSDKHGYDAVVYRNDAKGSGGYLGCRWL